MLGYVLEACIYLSLACAAIIFAWWVYYEWKKIKEESRKYVRCRKCGSADVVIKYRHCGEVWRELGEVESEYILIEHGLAVARKECLSYHCRRCEFDWETDVLTKK